MIDNSTADKFFIFRVTDGDVRSPIQRKTFQRERCPGARAPSLTGIFFYYFYKEYWWQGKRELSGGFSCNLALPSSPKLYNSFHHRANIREPKTRCDQRSRTNIFGQRVRWNRVRCSGFSQDAMSAEHSRRIEQWRVAVTWCDDVSRLLPLGRMTTRICAFEKTKETCRRVLMVTHSALHSYDR